VLRDDPADAFTARNHHDLVLEIHAVLMLAERKCFKSMPVTGTRIDRESGRVTAGVETHPTAITHLDIP
jgi:hypothetical protein